MAKLLCPECGYEFDGNRPACPECGCPASECVSVNDNRQQENETKPSAPSHSPVQNRMGNLNTCRECGHQISIDAKRCPQCGAKGIYAPLDYGDSIYDCFCRKFAKFSGRSRRSEVFPFFVCVLFIWLILSFGYPTLAYIFLLITAIPWFAAVARRLHDIGRNGWWVICPVIPWIFMFRDSDKETNEYGKSPKYDPNYVAEVLPDKGTEIAKWSIVAAIAFIIIYFVVIGGTIWAIS